MWSVWQVFCDIGFHSACPLKDEDKKLMGASCWERLTVRELGLDLMGGTMLSKCLIQFSVDGRSCFPPCSLTWDQTKVEVMRTVATSFQRSQAGTTALSAPDRASSTLSTHASAKDSWTPAGKPGSVPCGVPTPFSRVLVHTSFCLCPPRVCFPSPV